MTEREKKDILYEFNNNLIPDIENTESCNIENLSYKEYNSIIENYNYERNIKLTKTLRWIEKQIKKSTKNKYVKKEKVYKIMEKICKDLDIKSSSLGNFPF